MPHPTIDRVMTYIPSFGAPGRCRLRLFETERVAVVTELAANTGMSITNAAEEVGRTVEAIADARVGDGGWQLVEHYDEASYGPDAIGSPIQPSPLCVVLFRSRDRRGQLCDATWAPLPDSLAWLYAALEAPNAVTQETVT